MTSPARRALLAEVAAGVPVRDRGTVLVAVDGVDGAGKTTFADELGAVLSASRSSAVVRASVDGFHHPAAHRHALGRTAQTVWSRSYDYDAFLRELVEPWRRGPGSRYRRAVRDLASDRALDVAPDVVPLGGVLVVDGIFLQREELQGSWDLTVFLDVPFAVSVRRMADRDGSAPDPEHPSQARYVEAQRTYLASCDPRGGADLVVDNTDLENPRLL